MAGIAGSQSRAEGLQCAMELRRASTTKICCGSHCLQGAGISRGLVLDFAFTQSSFSEYVSLAKVSSKGSARPAAAPPPAPARNSKALTYLHIKMCVVDPLDPIASSKNKSPR